MKTAALQKQLDRLITVKQAMYMFDVSQPTIQSWRDKGMPTVIVKSKERPAIRFVVDDIKAWAKENGKTVRGLIRAPLKAA